MIDDEVDDIEETETEVLRVTEPETSLEHVAVVPVETPKDGPAGGVEAVYRVLVGLNEVYDRKDAIYVGEVEVPRQQSGGWISASVHDAVVRKLASMHGGDPLFRCHRVIPLKDVFRDPETPRIPYLNDIRHQVLVPLGVGYGYGHSDYDYAVLDFDLVNEFPEEDHDLDALLRDRPDTRFLCRQQDVPEGYVIRKNDTVRLKTRNWGGSTTNLYLIRKAIRKPPERKRMQAEIYSGWRSARLAKGFLIPEDFNDLSDQLHGLGNVLSHNRELGTSLVSFGFRIDCITRSWRYRTTKADEPKPSQAEKIFKDSKIDIASVGKHLLAVCGAISKCGLWWSVRKTENYKVVKACFRYLLPHIERAAAKDPDLNQFRNDFMRAARRFGVQPVKDNRARKEESIAVGTGG